MIMVLYKNTKEFQETSKKSMERMPPLLRLCRVDISKQLVSCIAEPGPEAPEGLV